VIPTLKFLMWPGPACIFEIGACQGEDTLKYAQAFSRAQIYAFEPLPENFEVLRQSIAVCERAQAWQLALGDVQGDAVFHVSSGAPATEVGSPGAVVSRSSSLLMPAAKRPESLEWLTFDRSIRVSADTLDSFCVQEGVERIDFVHMDVQGAELKVLAGAKRMLPRIRAIWMEVAFEQTYEGQCLEPETTRWMVDRGFRKIHQVSYGPEGDALYYNMRMPLSCLRFIVLRLLQKIGVVER
jgi:FkbM family methyltransferase